MYSYDDQDEEFRCCSEMSVTVVLHQECEVIHQNIQSLTHTTLFS